MSRCPRTRHSCTLESQRTFASQTISRGPSAPAQPGAGWSRGAVAEAVRRAGVESEGGNYNPTKRASCSSSAMFRTASQDLCDPPLTRLPGFGLAWTFTSESTTGCALPSFLANAAFSCATSALSLITSVSLSKPAPSPSRRQKTLEPPCGGCAHTTLIHAPRSAPLLIAAVCRCWAQHRPHSAHRFAVARGT